MKPTIPQVLPLLQDYYDRHPGGGSLHIFLEDGNVGDGHMLGIYDMATHGPETQAYERYMLETFGPPRHPEPERPIDYEGAALALVLLAMSRTQRRKLYRKLGSI